MLLPMLRVETASRAARNLRPAEWATLAPFAVFCFVYPFALFLLSFDLMPFGMEWMSSLLLAMLGLTAASWLWLNYGAPGGAIGALVFVLGIGLEYVGVSTGVPFGDYRYTGVLVPSLPGGVPLAIGFAWLMIVVAGLYTARWLVRSKVQSPKSKVSRARLWTLDLGPWTSLLGAMLVVGLDLLLEPVAYLVKGYWEWLGGSPAYYGVPWGNFASWFGAALVLNLLVSVVVPRRQVRWPWVPVALYAMNVVLFGVVSVAHGLWLPGVVGLLLLALLLARGVSGGRAGD
jgi:bisanhydrobacterioruberin hydratase